MPGITAQRTHYPGDLIYSEEPFAWVLHRSKKDECCEFCCEIASDLITCKECSAVRYCGEECQAKDSINHGMECMNMDKLEDGSPVNFIRLVAKIIFQVKGKDWKTITKNVMGKEMSFEDIDPHYEEMTKNPRLVLMHKGIKECLKKFIGEENMPEEEELIKIVGKVKYSTTNLSGPIGIFCFGLDLFEHDCIPNCNIKAFGKVLKIWAIKKINEGSEKITVSYRSILTTDLFRSPLTSENIEVCKCTECSLPYGESILTKIIDERKAYRVIRGTEIVLQQAEVLNNFDLENDRRLKILIDDRLQKHEGVLGKTNALHLKILALKALTVEESNLEKKLYLTELAQIMGGIFGEYYSELMSIYKALIRVNYQLKNVVEASLYLKKCKKLDLHEPE